jgi:hypothetical protein
MGSVAKLWKFAAIFVLFLIALSGSVELSQTNKRVIDKTDEVIFGADLNVAQDKKVMGEYTVSGAEVLQSIYHIHEIGADIQVDGTQFSQSLIIDQTDVSVIKLNRTYAATYVRNRDGSLNQVVFNVQ